jgi:hypothetical protein
VWSEISRKMTSGGTFWSTFKDSDQRCGPVMLGDF